VASQFSLHTFGIQLLLLLEFAPLSGRLILLFIFGGLLSLFFCLLLVVGTLNTFNASSKTEVANLHSAIFV
jgi:TRAP-type C4-dicarboxylate transport system permease small subunit